MIAVDTNVLARWVMGDDPVQSPIAETVLAQPVFVSLTVLLELGWVLHKARGLDRAIAAQLLERVVDLDTATVEETELARWAISRFQDGGDWGDMLHLVASAGRSTEFATFDRRLARDAGESSPLTISLLRAAKT